MFCLDFIIGKIPELIELLHFACSKGVKNKLSFPHFRLFCSESVCVVFTFRELTRPNFPLGDLGNFALFELPMFLWGTILVS